MNGKRLRFKWSSLYGCAANKEIVVAASSWPVVGIDGSGPVGIFVGAGGITRPLAVADSCLVNTKGTAAPVDGEVVEAIGPWRVSDSILWSGLREVGGIAGIDTCSDDGIFKSGTRGGFFGSGRGGRRSESLCDRRFIRRSGACGWFSVCENSTTGFWTGGISLACLRSSWSSSFSFTCEDELTEIWGAHFPQ